MCSYWQWLNRFSLARCCIVGSHLTAVFDRIKRRIMQLSLYCLKSATLTVNEWFTSLCCCKLLSVWSLIYIYLHCILTHAWQRRATDNQTSLPLYHLASWKKKKNGFTNYPIQVNWIKTVPQGSRQKKSSKEPLAPIRKKLRHQIIFFRCHRINTFYFILFFYILTF